MRQGKVRGGEEKGGRGGEWMGEESRGVAVCILHSVQRMRVRRLEREHLPLSPPHPFASRSLLT